MIKKHQITEWINHPVTQTFLELIKEHQEANKTAIGQSIIYGPSLTQLDLHIISQMKGQILAFEEVLNIKEYLVENIEEAEENAISSIGTQSSS